MEPEALAVDRVPVHSGARQQHADNDDVWLVFHTHDGHEHSVEASGEEDIPSNYWNDDHADSTTTIVDDAPEDTRTVFDNETTFELEEGSFLHADFNATCRLATRLGAAAMNNGSLAENVERFLPKLMSVYGYHGYFTCSTLELSCNFEKEDPQDGTIVRIQNVPIEAGKFQLTRLCTLSDLAKDLLQKRVGIQEATKRLEEIENTPDPWGVLQQTICFMLLGGCLPALLNGSWWDMMVGPFSGAIAYGLIFLFEVWPSRVHIRLNLIASFMCSTLGFAVQLVQPKVDPSIVTISGILVLFPSNAITLGINDLVSNHVLSGFERSVKGLLIFLWLALGYVLGMTFVGALAPKVSKELLEAELMGDVDVEPIPAVWKILFIPILCASLSAADCQMSGKDWISAIVCMVLGYVASYFGITFFDQPYMGSFIGSVVVSMYANVWSRYYDRPNTVILAPAFQLVVAGVVGFMGLTEIVQGRAEEGGQQQVLHMLTVAGVVIIGFLVVGTVVQPFTTI